MKSRPIIALFSPQFWKIKDSISLNEACMWNNQGYQQMTQMLFKNKNKCQKELTISLKN